MKFNKTKIIATIGPSTSDFETLNLLVDEGVNIIRLNFSHGSQADHQLVINSVRRINREKNTNIALVQDLQGPKLRVGDLENNQVLIESGSEIILTSEKVLGTSRRLYISYPNLADDVKAGERILLDDGKIELIAIEKFDSNSIKAKVVYGGLLLPKKGVNFPNTVLSIPSLTAKDIDDLEFGLMNEVEWVALSFVRRAEDIIQLKNIIRQKGKNTKVIAKIEKPEAIKNLDEIIAESDAVMVARGDLGVEVDLEMVPILQKEIVQKAIQQTKPVIIATQIMESMIQSPTPTRAETNDVTNAVLDGADALMLSGETSVGKFPVKVIQTMYRIISYAEKQKKVYNRLVKTNHHSATFLSDEVCLNACTLASRLHAAAIVGMTNSGYTAFKLAACRPEAPIIIFTNQRWLLNTISLVWGVSGFYYDKFVSTDETFSDVNEILLKNEVVKLGECIINTASMPIHEKNRTNTIKVSVVK